MRPSALNAFVLVAAALVLTACDRLGDIAILPEFDLAYSFDGSMEQWVTGGLDLGDPEDAWNIGVATDVVSSGSGSVRLSLDNANGMGKIWIIRQFEVEAGREYDIEIHLDVAAADAADPWRVLASAHTEPPVRAEDLSVQDAAGTGDGGYAWETRTYTVRGTADDEGTLYVLLGVWGTTPDARAYYLDNVRLVFFRADQGDEPAGTGG